MMAYEAAKEYTDRLKYSHGVISERNIDNYMKVWDKIKNANTYDDIFNKDTSDVILDKTIDAIKPRIGPIISKNIIEKALSMIRKHSYTKDYITLRELIIQGNVKDFINYIKTNGKNLMYDRHKYSMSLSEDINKTINDVMLFIIKSRPYLLEQVITAVSGNYSDEVIYEIMKLLDEPYKDHYSITASIEDLYRKGYSKSIGWLTFNYPNENLPNEYYIDIHIEFQDINSFISRANEILIKSQKEYINVYICHTNNPKELFFNGFIPHSFIEPKTHVKEIMEYIHQGLSYNDIYYWVPLERTIDEELNSVRIWQWMSRDRAKYEASLQKSYDLLYSFPEMLYDSFRVRTDMSMFETSTSKVYVNKEDLPYNAIPVTRYSSGLDVGLYHKEKSEKNMCGTFYYYEPQSTTYLEYDTILVARTKIDVASILIEKLQDKYNKSDDEDVISLIYDLKFYLDDTSDHSWLNRWNNGELPEDLRVTPEEASKFFGIKQESFLYDDFIDSNKKVYIGDHKSLELYASEDNFDQPVCKAASYLGIDIIKLTHMVGSHQVVVEILDSRDRSVSFESLIFKSSNAVEDITIFEKYGKVKNISIDKDVIIVTYDEIEVPEEVIHLNIKKMYGKEIILNI